MSTGRRAWRVAAAQMTSTADVDANLRTVEALCRRAARAGADLVAFPENLAWVRPPRARRIPAEPLEGPGSRIVPRLRDAACAHRVWLLAGSVPEARGDDARIHNTSLLLSPEGGIVAVYRKIHLFDVHIRGRVRFEESRLVAAGERPVVADTPLGRLGLSICYDLRFPELYRHLAHAGAEVLFVPAAFTAYTGQHHWMTLLRARAIENGCWVVAPAQAGVHHPGRESFGHAAVIDPWGTVVAVRRRGVGLVLAEIDLGRVDEVRRGLPCLEHARPDLFAYEGAPARRRARTAALPGSRRSTSRY